MEGISMTYMTSPRLRSRYGNRRPMGGMLLDAIGEDYLERFATKECLAKANANTANLDAQINDLAANWRPTGFYTPAQVKALVSNVMSVITNARGAVAQASSATGVDADGQTQLRQSLADMQRNETRSLEYLAAATAAERSGARAVDAPGMKTWVTNAMTAASSAFVTADVIMCLRPGWIIFMAGFMSLVGSVVNAVKKIVGVVVAAGEAVIDIAADAAESLPMVWTLVKWGGLAALGVLAVWKMQEYRKGRGL
jgi:hypothetical protein